MIEDGITLVSWNFIDQISFKKDSPTPYTIALHGGSQWTRLSRPILCEIHMIVFVLNHTPIK